MDVFAAQFETGVVMAEAWQRVSATQLRKKIIKTWTREYVGIDGQAAAAELLETEIALYENVREGSAHPEGAGLWGVTISFKTATWVEPAVYKEG